MGSYTPTIGLEIHAELKTRTKMFCDSKNDPDEKEPNKNICPICVGYPGTLPTINKEAVKYILKVGLAVGGKVSDFSEFDRKNYFYPDIPKGYQISQYKSPLVQGGELSQVKLERIHLEEDTARSLHEEGDYSLIDFNRSGIPLMELVTKPVIKSAKESAFFAKELQSLLQCLEAGEANMEKGEMRVEANVSVSPDNSLGTKVEIKNLNSFRSVEKAVDFEIERQIEILEKGDKVIQETRGWDEIKEKTFSQRLKEFSHDYRYFPEPDLPKLYIGEIPEFDIKILRKELPELPWEKRNRYQKIGLDTKTSEFKINPEHIEMFVTHQRYGKLFDEVCRLQPGTPKLIANYIASDIAGLVSKFGDENLKNITPERLAKVIEMLYKNEVSSRGAKDVLALVFKEGGDPQKIAEKENLLQRSDENELRSVVKEIIRGNVKVAADYRGGKEAALQFLVGQAMKETRGSANPEILKKLFISELGRETSSPDA